MTRYNAAWSALGVLNLLVLALVILINSVRFLRVIFSAFYTIFPAELAAAADIISALVCPLLNKVSFA